MPKENGKAHWIIEKDGIGESFLVWRGKQQFDFSNEMQIGLRSLF